MEMQENGIWDSVRYWRLSDILMPIYVRKFTCTNIQRGREFENLSVIWNIRFRRGCMHARFTVQWCRTCYGLILLVRDIVSFSLFWYIVSFSLFCYLHAIAILIIQHGAIIGGCGLDLNIHYHSSWSSLLGRGLLYNDINVGVHENLQYFSASARHF
jgi:hypothetical protein